MAVMTLQEKLTAAGASVATYRGAACLVWRTGRVCALLEGAAVFDELAPSWCQRRTACAGWHGYQ